MSGFAELTWPEAEAYDKTLLVPLGSTEQHGPHLPLDTDTRIAVAIAERAADRRADVVVGPALPYGASGEHRGFPGTLSIGSGAMTTVLIELGRSAMPPFRRMVFVNGHGGNAAAMHMAVEQLRPEGRDVTAWSPTGDEGDAHAGHTETSLLLAVAPRLVRLERAAPGNVAPLAEIAETLLREGVRAVSPNGVLGDPTDATAEVGEALLTTYVSDLTAHITDPGRR